MLRGGRARLLTVNSLFFLSQFPYLLGRCVENSATILFPLKQFPPPFRIHWWILPAAFIPDLWCFSIFLIPSPFIGRLVQGKAGTSPQGTCLYRIASWVLSSSCCNPMLLIMLLLKLFLLGPLGVLMRPVVCSFNVLLSFSETFQWTSESCAFSTPVLGSTSSPRRMVKFRSGSL